MKTLDYHCCFCGKAGTVQYEDPGVDISSFLKVLPKNIACNRCATFERAKRDTKRTIFALCDLWLRKTDEAKAQNVGKFREQLNKHLHALCATYEKRFSRPPLFEPEMIEQIISMPLKAGQVLYRLDGMAQTKVKV